MKAPEVKTRCPGAWAPMMSGDGLILRVRPERARLTPAQAIGLCDLAQRHSNGFIDLTNRANLQIRGLTEAGYQEVLQGLAGLNLLDRDAKIESRRNVLMTPFWRCGDLSDRLARRVSLALPRLPELPAKVGIAIDTGPSPILTEAPADFRFERGACGLILRADGCARGRPVAEDSAVDALIEMAEWFAAHRSVNRRRMAQLRRAAVLPTGWEDAAPFAAAMQPGPGGHALGALVGAAFGRIDAAALRSVMVRSEIPGLRVTPWRLLLLEAASMPDEPAFITDPGAPLLSVDACPGVPFCPQATVETRDLAEILSGRIAGSLHVSGCAKGCARSAAAEMVLVGRAGRFDLVRNGRAWDEPRQTGLTPKDILTGAF